MGAARSSRGPVSSQTSENRSDRELGPAESGGGEPAASTRMDLPRGIQ